MKAKYLFWGLAALGFVACTETNDGTEGLNPVVGGGTKGYLAINLKAADDVTRADKAVYEDGTADEQAISKAAFYFFDATGNAFAINNNGNYFNATISDNGGKENPNIESMTDAVLVIEKYKGQFPSSVVAVVNYTANKSLSLSDLKNTMKDAGHTNGTNFIMTNSVYMNAAGEEVDATPLTIDHFHTTSDKALQNPVTIYVERMAAKVNVAAGDEAFNTGVKFGDKEVFAKINGWDLVANQTESYFVKTIDPEWKDTDLGFTWNDVPFYRSYWTDKCVDAQVSNAFVYANLKNTDATIEYVGEQVGAINTHRTKYIVAATLQDNNGNELEIAQWYGTNYAGEEALLAAVAATLQNKFMHKDGATYTSIDDSQLQCVAGLIGAESYEVKFQLSVGVPTTDWYSFDGNTYTPIADVNGELAKLEPAKVWNDGKAYYYADVKHLGSKDTDGEFGIVRNHSYKIKITGVKGWGTPVYDPNWEIEEPKKPTDKETYVAAEINVLSWRVVSRDVTLE